MRALVTGATGFVGRSLVRRLVQEGHEVRALVRPRQRGGPDPVVELRGMGADIVGGTVFDSAALGAAVAQADAVFHAAWQVSRPTIPGAADAGSTDEQWHENVEGSRLLIEAAKQAGVNRMVFMGTVAVYPPGLASPMREDGPTLSPDAVRDRPALLYPAMKLAVEEMMAYLLPPPDYVVLRPSMVYGAGALFAPELLKSILQGTNPRRAQPVNWIHVDDLANAALLAAQGPGVHGMTFNLAGRETVAADQLCDAIYRIADCLIRGVTNADRLAFDLLHPRYDTSLAQRFLGFVPAVNLADGLQPMISAALAQLEAEDAVGSSPPASQQWEGR